MIRYYCFFIAVLLLTACVNKRDKSDFKRSFQPCDNNLSIELYTVFGSGAFGGDLLSAYLTDSTNFRMYIGTFDDAQGGYFCECRGDTIVVEEIMTTDTGDKKVVRTKTLSLKQLKKQGKFE